jgi:hypothetical protein
LNTKFKPEKNKVVVDTLLLAGIFVFLIVIFVLSLQLGKTAGEVPKLITGVGIILCVIQFFTQVKKLRAGVYETVESEGITQQTLAWYWNLLLIAVFIICLMLLGFIISTFLYLLLVPYLMDYKRWKVNIVFSAVTTSVLYYSFDKFFHVRLPPGLLLSKLF